MKQNPCPILLVDDLEENLLSLSALLKNEKLEILTARSGLEALEILLKNDVGLALLDVQMPEMNGFELAELMRGMDRTKTVPIIFVTAGSNDQQRQFKGYEAGAVDFISKPIEPHIIKSKVSVFADLYEKQLTLIQQRNEIQKSRDDIARLLQESTKLAETLKTADRNKNEFMATLAHELRNPLSPLQGALDIIKSKPTPDRLQELHKLMTRQVNHLIHLIDDLMDMSRVSQGKIDLKKEKIDIKDAIQLALDISTPIIDQMHHNFIVKIDQSDMFLEADKSRIAQIVGNLLHNAAKYTPKGGEISLDVFCESSQQTISIEVTDNGVGIPADRQEEIFQIFTQLKKDDMHSSGLGIGLSLVKKLVDLHGGSIHVQSDGTGKGSKFIVKLPALQMNTESNDINTLNKALSDKNRQLKILVIDDNKEAALTIGMMVELFGHLYTAAHTGQDALHIAKIEKPDVILLDIGLPDMTGYDVAKEIKKMEGLEHTILIAQTGWGMEADKLKSKNAGFAKHLVKPVSIEELEDTINETLH